VKNPELMALIKEHNLTSNDVAKMLEVAPNTVNNWRRDGSPEHQRKMSRSHMKLLKMSLANL
jgi:DNA-binding XRE family transcriptional regulator